MKQSRILRVGALALVLLGAVACSSQTSSKAPGTPGAPIDVFATAGNGSASVTWKAPASAGASAITGYTVTADPGGEVATTTGATTVTITGLTNGTPYVVSVVATNAAGAGPGTLSNIVTPESGAVPVTLPGAPIGVVAVAGDQQATVSWTAPTTDTGGGALEKYVVTVTPGGATTMVSGTTTMITGLADGTTYVFSVAATNAAGTGPSASSNAVAPEAASVAPVVPGAPAGVTVSAVGDGWAAVTWTAPASDGGSPILSYTVTPSGGSPTTVPAAATSATIAGLTDGIAYTFSAFATNAVGNGPSATSSSATPIGLPEAPVGVLAVAGNQQATVTWNPPDDTGGSPIASYVVTVTPGGATTTVFGTSTIVTGLTDGDEYVISVAATNTDGTGPSAASNAVTIAPDAALSTFTATPPGTFAEDPVTLRLVLENSSGGVLAGWPVTLAATGTDMVLDHASGTTDATGTFVAQLSSPVAQTVEVVATTAGLTLSLSVTFAPAVVCSGSVSFSTASTPSVGNSPQGVAVGDFNGDGKLDIVATNTDANTVSVLLGNGDGTFQTQLTDSVGSYPEGVAAGDFNGDGKLDIVEANWGANTISVLLGNGNGTFQTQLTDSVGSYPGGVAVGDFNGDGKLDIVATNGEGNTVSVLLGNGDGTFQTQLTDSVGSTPLGVAVGDFDGDGNLDIVDANSDGIRVSVLLGNGDGTFQPQVTYPANSPTQVAVGDFNGDGKLDIVAANEGGDTASVLLGNGDGTFQTPLTDLVGSNPEGVAAGDFNGDGKLDIVTANWGMNTASVLLGNGDGTFQTQLTDSVGSNPWGVAVGDFNGDGKLDIVTANYVGDTVSMLLNTCE